MSSTQDESSKIQEQMLRLETLEGLQQSLDKRFRRLIETARTDWERLFAGKHPGDACVSVNIIDIDPRMKSVPGSGFLKSRRQSKVDHGRKRSQPRFAH